MALPTPRKEFLRGWGSSTRQRMQAAARDVLQSKGLQLSRPPPQALGSDCCGMSAEVLAMKELGFQHTRPATSAKAQARSVRRMLLPAPFSGMSWPGRRRRWRARGSTVAQAQLYAILENVQGIMSFWASVSAKVRAMLPGYRLLAVKLCPTQLGRGLRRPRVFILCLREDSLMVGSWRTTKALVAAMLRSVAQQKMQKPLSMFLLPSASAKAVTKQKKPVAGTAQASRRTRAAAKWILKHREAQRKAGKLPPRRNLSFLTAREAEVLQFAEAKLGLAKVLAGDVSQSVDRMPCGDNL